MTLNRIILRLAALSALSNFGTATGPFPTLAKDQVFDSRIEPQEAFEGRKPFPIVVIYTDYDRDFTHHGTLSDKRLITLTFEILMVQTAQISLEDPDGGTPIPALTYDVPQTDGEMEISLDIFEAQVFNALFADNPAAACFKYLCSKIVNVISRRGASAEGGGRISARQITIEMDMARDPQPGILPPAIANFLDALEERYVGIGEKAFGLRELYTTVGTLTDVEKMISLMGWSPGAAEAMGQETGLPVFMPPPPVVFLDPMGKVI